MKWTDIPTIGSIFNINIDLPANDGSVICINHDTYSWTFATISDPYNLSHPVSGNRQFGLEPNGSGGYTFFTRGTDRAFDELSGGTRDILNYGTGEWIDLLDQGARPWRSLQQLVESFIDNNGGSSTKREDFFERPDFQEIGEYYNGERTIDEITVLPCN